MASSFVISQIINTRTPASIVSPRGVSTGSHSADGRTIVSERGDGILDGQSEGIRCWRCCPAGSSEPVSSQKRKASIGRLLLLEFEQGSVDILTCWSLSGGLVWSQVSLS
ncbi:hypothetical protein MUK42_34548 [Musa troglodytarum]|uniref:Uncharacterized protein n=1 Tax=Musa troglodytarum TaxID=320322 RepID=A0A9E7JT11_9LILI|nr:hypothetical protein MUK42_34548 [Musa troglodytarum]